MAKKKVKKSKKIEKPSKKGFISRNQKALATLAILVITILVFLPSLQNDFVNWDDDKNFYENPLVTSSTSIGKLIKNTPELFSTQIIGNYNPLSNWTFALENAVFGIVKPFYWHLDNLFLHLICVFLIFRISLALGLNLWSAVICALLFGIHPMRVESVAWVTERKDVLFGAFYLMALLYYIKGVNLKNPNLHIYKIILLFIVACLAKIQAVTLPLSMLAVDYYLGRPVAFKRIIEKWYYFLISLAMGLLGIYFLKENGSLESATNYAFYDRLFIGSYSYTIYYIKLLIPFPLSPLYPYPADLKVWHYLSMIPAIGVVGLTFWAYLKEWKALVFGILFFTFNVMFLLQILGAGQGYLADRFTYISYFGLFFTAAFYLGKLQVILKNGMLVNVVVSILLVAFSYLTYQQCKIWKNSGTLWTHVLKHYDNTALPYGNRANFYRDNGYQKQALIDYNKAISLGTKKSGPYNSRAKLYFQSNNRDTVLLALADYSNAILLEPNNAEYYMNRGATSARLNNLQNALIDLQKAGELDPGNPNIYLNRSIVYHQLGQIQNEIIDINSFLSINPNHGDMWANLGNAYMLLGQWDKALNPANQSIKINPNAGVYYFYRAQFYYNTGNAAAAQQDINNARKLGYPFNGTIEDLRM